MTDDFSLAGAKVGDTLIVTDYRGKPYERKVAKVGRSLVHLDGWDRLAYYIADGCERRSPNAAGVRSTAFTPDGYDRMKHRADVEKRYSVAIRPYGAQLTTDQMERILAILDETAR